MIPPEAPAAPSGSTLARSFGAGTALDLFPPRGWWLPNKRHQ
jgi:hypothetical protein